MPLRVIDLFCGTGAFSKGFEQTGDFDVVFGVDIKTASMRTFAANHAKALAVCSDIRSIAVRDVAEKLGRKVDVIVAGPPCQGFSSIRPFRSINETDSRNTLFEQLVVFVNFFRPNVVVFENVVGLITHRSGTILKQIQESLETLGYSTAVGVLNAVSFGVPQKRERVFVVGRRGRRRISLPEPTHYYDGRSMAGSLAVRPMSLFGLDLARPVTVEEAIFDLPPVEPGQTVVEYQQRPASGYARARRKKSRRLTLHSATRHTPRMVEIIRKAGRNRWALPDGLTSSGFSSSYSRLDADEPATTITVNFVHPASNRCIHPCQDRALTPREGARLQGFDDDFMFCGSRTEIVKQIGEAVPPLLGKAVAKAVLDQW